MIWKTVLLPLVSLVMLVVNVVQLADQLSRPGSDSPVGTVLMTLVWLALLVFSLRFALSRRKGNGPQDPKEKDQ